MNLEIASQLEVDVDFLLVQDVSDESQDRAIICLMKLTQRLLTAAPMTDHILNFSRMNATPFAERPPKLGESEPPQVPHAPAANPKPDKQMGYHAEIWAPATASPRKKSNIFGPMFRRPNKSTEFAPFDSNPMYSGLADQTTSSSHAQDMSSQSQLRGVPHQLNIPSVPSTSYHQNLPSRPIVRHGSVHSHTQNASGSSYAPSMKSQSNVQNILSQQRDQNTPSVEDYHELVEQTRHALLDSPTLAPRRLSPTNSLNSYKNGGELDPAEYDLSTSAQPPDAPLSSMTGADHSIQPRDRRQSQLMPEALKPRMSRERQEPTHHQENSPTLGPGHHKRPTFGSSGSHEMSPTCMKDENNTYDSTPPTSSTSQIGPFSPYMTGYTSQESIESWTQPESQKKGPDYNWVPQKAPQRLVERGANVEITSFPLPPKVPARDPARSIVAKSQPITPTSPMALPPAVVLPRRSTFSSVSGSKRMSLLNGPRIAPSPTKVIAPKVVGSARGYLPSAENEYAGFCKGKYSPLLVLRHSA